MPFLLHFPVVERERICRGHELLFGAQQPGPFGGNRVLVAGPYKLSGTVGVSPSWLRGVGFHTHIPCGLRGHRQDTGASQYKGPTIDSGRLCGFYLFLIFPNMCSSQVSQIWNFRASRM